LLLLYTRGDARQDERYDAGEGRWDAASIQPGGLGCQRVDELDNSLRLTDLCRSS
jgi:hypothetical protein